MKNIFLLIVVFAPLLLIAQQKVGVGTTTPEQRFSIDSAIVIDQGNFDDGTKPSFHLGSNSGEGIGSGRQSPGSNYKGLDLYTNSTKRLTIANDGSIGIGQTHPVFPLELYAPTGKPVLSHFEGDDPLFTTMHMDGTNANSLVGYGFMRNHITKAFIGINANNDLQFSKLTGYPGTTTPAMTIANANGNIGIGTVNPGFPLSFPNSMGDKISLYGTSTYSYGFGVGVNTLQIHTDVSFADIVFGYGSSAAFNENMRIAGNGDLSVKNNIILDATNVNDGFSFPGFRFGTGPTVALASKKTTGGNKDGLDIYTNGFARVSVTRGGQVGIGTTLPGAQLQIAANDGHYTGNENDIHALEIWDGNETLYMGADAEHDISYIQAVGSNLFHTLALNARGGNVAIGKPTAAEKLEVNGNALVNGNIIVQSNKGILRNYSSAQLKTETFTYTFPSLVTLGPGNTTSFSISFPENYSSAPAVFVAGLVVSGGSSGFAECVYNVTNITSTDFTLYVYNPRSSGVVFNNGSPNFAINLVAIGAQ